MNDITFSPTAWSDYLYWQTHDKKIAQRINALIKDILREPFDGIGKPEPLKGTNGRWSRRIDDFNRIIYIVRNENDVSILSCRGHYEN